jgi:hypothetical protein
MLAVYRSWYWLKFPAGVVVVVPAGITCQSFKFSNFRTLTYETVFPVIHIALCML